ncbi:MAG: DEAD/DEAH box helicase, partial [Candidatus Bathyarchaeota archaeon]|nr:DEAD/DEAH box helicase [Candidatus Bathyarchaeota archaeon]
MDLAVEAQGAQENGGNVFNLLARPLRKLIEEKGFKFPTEPQAKVIPKILEGKNVLLISPTASGKTEAAMLPILHMLIQLPERKPGIKALYITPLRALNRDMLDRLEWWCNNLDIKLAVRHGDTDTNERSKQARSPPDILITTPETLQSILSGWIMRQHLQSIRWVVVDEVHELADSKRGSQLTLALERLRIIAGRDFQIIGLSATIGTPERVAQFLVGNNRPIEIVRVPVARLMKIRILYPKPEPQDYELASMLFTHPEVAARLRVMRQLIEKHNSVLLFTNTRTISEILASRFKIWDVNFPVSIHHGSLAKHSRIAAERGLKEGELRGLV